MKTYWHQHPDTIERLAAEYALGTMPPRARRRFEALMRQRADIEQAVWSWHDTMAPALAAQKPMPVDAGQWRQLEARLFNSTTQQPKSTSWWARWFGPIPSGMWAAGLVMGLAVPSLVDLKRGDADTSAPVAIRQAQLPDSYVGVLATANGQGGLVVSSLRHGLKVDIKQQVSVPVPSGHTLYLWQIDAKGQVRTVAAIPDMSASGFVSLALAQPAETVFKDAVELAVSIEAQGSTPTQPSGAWVYRGLCGKVWLPPKK